MFDTRGRLVARLLDESWAQGGGTVTWAGRGTVLGNAVAAGVYLARLEAEQGVWTRKLTLVR